MPPNNSVKSHYGVRLQHELFCTAVHVLWIKAWVVEALVLVEFDLCGRFDGFSLEVEVHVFLQSFNFLHGLFDLGVVASLLGRVIVKHSLVWLVADCLSRFVCL
jgi:hypothetical protein